MYIGNSLMYIGNDKADLDKASLAALIAVNLIRNSKLMPGPVNNQHASSYRQQAPAFTLNCNPPNLSLVIQRQPRLRTNLEHSRHLIQQRLVLNRIPALQRLDILGRRVHLLSQLRLRHLVGTLFRAAVADVLANLRGNFVRGDNVV